jgi:16S rRNA (guanine(1405)-N(7))-methyltransferase
MTAPLPPLPPDAADPPAPDLRVEEIVAAVRASRKYAAISDTVVRRMTVQALRGQATARAAERLVRAKLHQATGAYLTPGQHARVERAVGALEESDGADAPANASLSASAALSETARAILTHHASSAERMDFFERLYPLLFDEAALGQPIRRVLDLGCGLHPFALPWMGLARDVEYRAYDIDRRLLAAIHRFFACAGQSGCAREWDLIAPPPDRDAVSADVVLVLKTLPCLERQAPGAALRLLRSLEARRIVVSFPALSLGGYAKGMRENYDATMRGLAERLGRPCQRLDYPTETFYLLSSAVASA